MNSIFTITRRTARRDALAIIEESAREINQHLATLKALRESRPTEESPARERDGAEP